MPISESINKCGLFQRATFWFFSYHIMSRFGFLRRSCIRLSNFSSTLLSFAELANALSTSSRSSNSIMEFLMRLTHSLSKIIEVKIG